MKALKLALAGTLVALGAPVSSAAPTVGPTTVIGPFVGPNALLHAGNKPPANQTIAFAGTDLGWNYVHNGDLRVLFGDTHATQTGDPIDPAYTPGAGHTAYTFDDGFGTVDLDVWNNPAAFSSTNIPTILLAQHASSTNAKALNPQHWQDGFKTPFGGWSNGTQEFGIFYTSKPQGCQTNNHCDDHLSNLTCDTGLAFWNEEYFDQKSFTGVCTDYTWGCLNDTMVNAFGFPIPGTGFCRDTTSTIYSNNAVGRILATGTKHHVGVRSATDEREYVNIKVWLTTKFRNITLATVQDFVPADGSGYQNHNYNVAQSSGSARRVLLWGRPGFVGINATNRNTGLYFGYIDMPTSSTFTWSVKYYTGTVAGVPQFSTSESAAVALDLNSAVAGVQATEVHDIVLLQNVVWVDHLKKWVMLYGGSLSNNSLPIFATCGITEFFVGAAECAQVARGNHAIRMRTADDPWGPWSTPQDFFVPGNPQANPPTGYYNGTGGAGTPNIFYHPNCSGTCRAHYNHPLYNSAVEFGVPYAPNIVVPWITAVGNNVDVTWLMSTWNPYGVYVMKTRINAN